MKGRLLVTDCEPVDRDVVQRVFSSKYGICFAAAAGESQSVCPKFSPDVALLEMRRPDMQELAEVAMQTCVSDPPIPLVPIISENNIELERFARAGVVRGSGRTHAQPVLVSPPYLSEAEPAAEGRCGDRDKGSLPSHDFCQLQSNVR